MPSKDIWDHLKNKSATNIKITKLLTIYWTQKYINLNVYLSTHQSYNLCITQNLYLATAQIVYLTTTQTVSKQHK